ncbi:MAG: hypothetical protein EBT81_12095 [Gammaproteobacteria bacterium]|nr:hypothetical protein [Gammaproteobacteria bacterium]
MSRILVALSGGVDSAVAALLLKRQGHEVHAAYFRTWMNEEGLHRDLTQEADALAVLALGVRQGGLGGQSAHLGLEQFADREDRLGQLILPEQGEEVGLILVRVESLEQVEGSIGVRASARIVTGRDLVVTVGQGPPEEDPELHLAVADDVGIRRAALSVAGHRLRVLEGIATDTALPARTITLHDERVMLGCVTGSVVCEKVQPEGRSAMEAVAWWRGHRGPDTLVADDD